MFSFIHPKLKPNHLNMLAVFCVGCRPITDKWPSLKTHHGNRIVGCTQYLARVSIHLEHVPFRPSHTNHFFMTLKHCQNIKLYYFLFFEYLYTSKAKLICDCYYSCYLQNCSHLLYHCNTTLRCYILLYIFPSIAIVYLSPKVF